MFLLALAVTFLALLILLSLVATLPNTWLPGFDDLLPAAITDRPYYEVPVLAVTTLALIAALLLIVMRFGLKRADAARLLVATILAVGATVLVTNASLGGSFSIGSWSIAAVVLVFILLVSVGSFLWASEMSVIGSRQQLGAGLLSGAVVSLVVLVLQVDPAADSGPSAADVRAEHVAQTRDLRWFDAAGLKMPGSYLPHRDFRDAILRRADLSDADLSDSLFSNSDLSNASLCGTALIWTDLTGANLSGADLRNADLRGANLTGAELGDDLTTVRLRVLWWIRIRIGRASLTLVNWRLS